MRTLFLGITLGLLCAGLSGAITTEVGNSGLLLAPAATFTTMGWPIAFSRCQQACQMDWGGFMFNWLIWSLPTLLIAYRLNKHN